MEIKGMYDDSLDRANHPEGTWSTNTRNIVITKDKKAVKNEDGFNFYAYGYPNNATPIGFISLYNDEVIIFSVTDTSEIGIIHTNGNYETIVKDDGFGFDINYPVSGRHHYNIYGHTEIVFTDNHVPVKVLNITKLPFEVNGDKTLVDPTQLNNAFLFPEVILPKIEVTEVGGSGGNITTGSIFFTGQYVDYNGFATNAFPLTNPTRIIPINSSYDQISGVPSGTKTSNIVKLAISNIDTRFKELKLFVVRKEASQYYGEEFVTLTIHGGTTTAVYTGLEATTNKSLSSILVDRPVYTTASSVLVSDDVLYLADVGAKPKLNIQKYVNNWKVKYVTDVVAVNQLSNSYKDGKIGFVKSTFMHNEVYALYAVVTMKEGDFQYAFHIPGREARQITGVGIAGIWENEFTAAIAPSHTYLYDDVQINSDTRYYQTRDTSGFPDGTLGYWENQNEFYPNTEDFDIVNSSGTVIGTLRDKKVRHHKMPSHGRHGYLNTVKQCNILGLEITDIYLPDDIKEQIQNIEICYAKRTGANSTLTGRALFMFAGRHWFDVPTNDYEIVSNAGNWNIETPNAVDSTIEPTMVRMYAFDMLVDKTNVMPNFIYNNYKIRVAPVKTPGSPNNGDSSLFFKLDLTDLDTTNPSNITNAKEEYRVRGLYNQRYLPFNTNVGTIDGIRVNNRYCEETFFAFLKANAVSSRPDNHTMDLFITTVNFEPSGAIHETYTTDLCVWKPNVYNRYDEQELVSTGYRIDISPTIIPPATNIFGGDGYVGTQGVVLTGPTMNTYDDEDEHDGIRTLVKFYVETANPPELQYGWFYPKVDLGASDEYLNTSTRNDTEYPISFHKDYTVVNSLNVVSHIDFDALYITRYRNRILRSTQAERGALTLAWREFLPNNYYDTARDRGAIIHLEAINGEILIQHEYGLYITRGSEQLQTDVTTVEVGTGDVFARPPKEIMDSKDGYVGCNSKFVCGKFKGGYFTADEKQGKIFIMDNSLKEISNSGMYGWFREHLPMLGNTPNNAFTSSGLCSSYDEVNNRIIFVKKQIIVITVPDLHTPEEPEPPSMVNLSFTVSYSLEGECWTCFHDYVPDAIFCTANKLMSFKDQRIYIHNQLNRKGLYYNVIPFKSQIEFIIANLLSKATHAINWKTQYKKAGVIDEKRTFTAIMLYNHNQCSGEQPITLKRTTRNAEGVWKFNDFRDLLKSPTTVFLDKDGNVIPSSIMANKSFFKKSRFIGDYLCIRMIFDNAESLPEIVLSDFSINDKVSYR